jgi:hypothetical protein
VPLVLELLLSPIPLSLVLEVNPPLVCSPRYSLEEGSPHFPRTSDFVAPTLTTWGPHLNVEPPTQTLAEQKSIRVDKMTIVFMKPSYHKGKTN